MIDIVEELLHLVRILLVALVMGALNALKARATIIAWGGFFQTKWVDILTSQEHTKGWLGSWYSLLNTVGRRVVL